MNNIHRIISLLGQALHKVAQLSAFVMGGYILVLYYPPFITRLIQLNTPTAIIVLFTITVDYYISFYFVKILFGVSLNRWFRRLAPEAI